MAFLVGIALAVLPAHRIVQWARFRNFNRWVGLAIVLLGIVLAEVSSATLEVIPTIGLELERLGVSVNVPMGLLKLLAAVGMGTAGTFIGQHSKSSRHAWEASRVISASAGSEEND